jgi:N-acetylmuramoyl-L-alanine amidase
MKYADRMARVATRLRERGYTVVEQPGWRTRGRHDFDSLESLIIHHTATGGTADYRSLKMVTDGRGEPNPLEGPLCNWGAGRLGTLYLIAAGTANHTGKTRELWQSNSYAAGLEAENDGVNEPWPSVMVDAMTAWAQEMRREFGIPQARVLGHKEVCVPVGRKIDPANFDMARFRKATDPPVINQEDDDLTEDQAKKLEAVYQALTGPDSVGSRIPPNTRMPWRTMVEFNNEIVTKCLALLERIAAKIGA